MTDSTQLFSGRTLSNREYHVNSYEVEFFCKGENVLSDLLPIFDLIVYPTVGIQEKRDIALGDLPGSNSLGHRASPSRLTVMEVEPPINP